MRWTRLDPEIPRQFRLIGSMRNTWTEQEVDTCLITVDEHSSNVAFTNRQRRADSARRISELWPRSQV